jgi:CRISPR-associated protein Cmr1
MNMIYATLELRVETPLVQLYLDPDWPLRPSEVKGLWRWWARALAAGALFERGLLHGAGRRDVVKTPTREEADCISQIVGLDMGLGYAGRREAQASCFRIRFEEINFAPPRDVSYSLAAKFQLLRQLVRSDYYTTQHSARYIGDGSATLVVEEHIPCSLDNRAVEAALGALALALRLSCFGWGGRRGLGCFSVKAYGRYSSLFTKEPRELIKRAMAAASAVVDRAVSTVDRTARCRGLWHMEPPKCALPPMPALSTARRYGACIKDSTALTPYLLVSVKGVRPEDLHNFFVPSTTQSASLASRDIAVLQTLKSLIIGTEAVARRPSPMMLVTAGRNAYLSVFTSADWPRELQFKRWPWRVSVTEMDILTATSLALKEFIDYAKKLGGTIEMWPP